MLKKLAIVGTASITTFFSETLVVNVRSRGVLSPGESMTSVLVADQVIFGCVEVDVDADGEPNPALLSKEDKVFGISVGALAKRNTVAASTTNVGTMIHAIQSLGQCFPID